MELWVDLLFRENATTHATQDVTLRKPFRSNKSIYIVRIWGQWVDGGWTADVVSLGTSTKIWPLTIIAHEGLFEQLLFRRVQLSPVFKAHRTGWALLSSSTWCMELKEFRCAIMVHLCWCLWGINNFGISQSLFIFFFVIITRDLWHSDEFVDSRVGVSKGFRDNWIVSWSWSRTYLLMGHQVGLRVNTPWSR